MPKITEFLTKNNFDYFLLPNNDEFFSEYLPENQKRIKFICGFDGSSATIVFSKKCHYFFTDSRYILQAQQQLDLQNFKIINIADKSVLSWLKDNVTNFENLALDAKILSKNFIDECQKILSKITFLQKNPIDEIFDELQLENKVNKTLLENSSLAFNCPINLTGEDFESKKNRALQNFRGDALFISKPENLNWLTNIRGDDIEFTPLFLAQGLLFKDGKLVIFADEARLKNINLPNTEIISKNQFEDYFKNFTTKKISLQTDFTTTNYWVCKVFEKNNLQYFNQPCPIEILKAVKNKTEIIGAKKSHLQDGIAMIKFMKWLDEKQKNQQKISEILAQEELLKFRMASSDFLYPSFATISAFSSNGAFVHYRATASTCKELVGDSLYLIDSGGQYFGKDFYGTTDITRTIAIGKPSSSMIENYTRVLKGHIALARVKFPRGTSGSNLDALARFHLWNAGKDYGHGTGHGVGSFLSVHEGPCGISKNSHQPLQVGMILSNEPGFYAEGEFGIRLENLMLVTEFNEKFLCFETLTLIPFELDLIDFKMLTYPEKKWLFDYHQHILSTLKDYLNQDEILWFNKFLPKQ